MATVSTASVSAPAADAQLPAGAAVESPAQGATYVRRSAFSSEVRPIGQPVTHAGDTPKVLAERRTLVRVRPHYYVPQRPHALTSTRSPFCFEAQVERVIFSGGEEEAMVSVRYTWESGSVPWDRTGAFKISELHRVHACECAACVGSGIHEHQGA